MAKGSGTRSSLLFEVQRILDECGDNLPQVLLMENVPMVIAQKNIEDFKVFEKFLEDKGYTNYIKILNAKDYGIPQNRRRCFMVSLLGNYSYQFPPEQKLEKKLSDMLENEVDQKYFLSEKALNGVLNTNYQSARLESRLAKNGICPTLLARDYKDAKLVMVEPSYLPIKEATKKGYAEAHIGDGIDISTRMETHRGCVQKGIAQTIKTQIDVGVVTKELKIRKLTPKECLRLMGWDDESIDKLSFQSNATLYKQAGNSIVVQVMEAIFKQLL